MNGKKLVLLLTVLALFLTGSVFGQARKGPSNDLGLADEIPEPPEASSELSSPIPMVVEFTGGLMAGDFDKCLQHFHVPTFLQLIFAEEVKVLQDADFRELYSFQIQAQRNEFRFMSKVMNRVAKGCKYSYSNPRYHQKVQSKVVVKMQTTKGPHEFVVYSRYVDERWQIYDYSLDGRRFTDSFRAGLNGMKPTDYTAMLRPFYAESKKKFKEVQNEDFGFKVKVPDGFQIREKVSPTLLFTASSFDNQFLLHVQAAVYPQPKSLKEVAAEIKQGLMGFNPRLYDQWKTDIAGVEIGNVVFRFEKNGRTLFTQMVIVPLGEKLVVFNFYHNSLPLMKNLSNVREKILESLTLTKVELAAADVTIPADDTSLPSQPPSELPPYQEGDNNPPPTDDGDNPPPPRDNGDEEPPPPQPDGDGEEPPPPPPPPDEEGNPPPPEGGDEDSPPPPPPPPDDDNPSYKQPEDGGGNEVSF